jgi:hypothetical protein
MACGDQYKYLVVTVDGYTIDNPYGKFPVSGDYSGWLALAKELRELANDAFLKLGEVEKEKVGSYPKYNALLPLQNNMIAHYDDLEYDWHQLSLTTGLIEEISKAVHVCVEAICLLERANVAITAYGSAVDVIPDITRKPESGETPWWVWALVGTGAVILVGTGVSYYRRKLRSVREPPRASRSGLTAGPVARRPTGAAA